MLQVSLFQGNIVVVVSMKLILRGVWPVLSAVCITVRVLGDLHDSRRRFPPGSGPELPQRTRSGACDTRPVKKTTFDFFAPKCFPIAVAPRNGHAKNWLSTYYFNPVSTGLKLCTDSPLVTSRFSAVFRSVVLKQIQAKNLKVVSACLGHMFHSPKFGND